MKAIHLVSYGDPAQGLVCVDIPEPDAPEAGQVIVQMEFSPINVSDLLVANGLFPTKPTLPAVIGGEGVGKVIALGGGVANVRKGDRVLIRHGVFAWAQMVMAPAQGLFIVPPEIDVRQASMLSINPPTAALLLREFVTLKPGEWLIQNSANSAVGRAVITFAHQAGVKTINIVRRPEMIPELKALGADVVLVMSPNIVTDIKAAVPNASIRLALDGVTGAATNVLAESLSADGVVVCYASATKEFLAMDLLTLVAKRLSVHGFSMYYPQFVPRLDALIAESAELMKQGKLIAPITATYPMTNVQEAVKHAVRGGKVLLDLS